ncbi:hypothetical protein TNCV_2951691 [Trichonephila clavipes]|nr:hypothetical protein TNCV_2951691 [Trichonephila clavipes]
MVLKVTANGWRHHLALCHDEFRRPWSGLCRSEKFLSPDEIANLLQEFSENESNGGELSCSNLDSDEDIRLSESDCEESEESADEMDRIYIPSLVYADEPQTLDHLEDNIRRVIADIRPQMLEKSSKIGRSDWTTSEPAVAVYARNHI